MKSSMILITLITTFLMCINCTQQDKAFDQELSICKEIESRMPLTDEDRSECIECYKKLILEFPKEIKAYEWLALSYINNNNCDSALAVLNEGLKIESQNFGLLYQKSLVKNSLGLDPNDSDIQMIEKLASDRALNEKKYDWCQDVAFLYGSLFGLKESKKYIHNLPIPKESKSQLEKTVTEAFSGNVHKYCGE
ncbi:MAG: hypothetical protein RLZZ546_159 [Bacteroidota bacterium]|jgi:hypothetical protein